jgi:hypothetical protein
MEYYEYLCMTEGGPQAPTDIDESSTTPSGLPRIDTDVMSVRSFQSHSRPVTSASVSTPFSHAPAYSWTQSLNPHPHLYPSFTDKILPQTYSTPGKFQTAEEDIEDFEEYLAVKENPLDVEEEDGTKKRYKAYRQWLKGKSFFKQSKVDPEWQNQLPVR